MIVHAPQIGLADLVVAAGRLRADAATVRDIAELLGIAPAPRPESTAAGSRWKAPVTITTSESPEAPAPTDTSPRIPPGGPVPISVVPAPPRPPLPPGHVRPLTDLVPAGADPEPRRGLFPPATQRALIRGVAASRRADGELDVERAVLALARRQPLRELPRTWLYVAGAGLQLLLDFGEPMEPFAADVRRFPAELTAALGAESFAPIWFRDAPAADAVWPADSDVPKRYRAPSPGGRALAVTAFGVRGGLQASPATIETWLRFEAHLRTQKVPLVALTPLSPRLRPRALVQRIPMITWDRNTTVRETTRALARATRTAGWTSRHA